MNNVQYAPLIGEAVSTAAYSGLRSWIQSRPRDVDEGRTYRRTWCKQNREERVRCMLETAKHARCASDQCNVCSNMAGRRRVRAVYAGRGTLHETMTSCPGRQCGDMGVDAGQAEAGWVGAARMRSAGAGLMSGK